MKTIGIILALGDLYQDAGTGKLHEPVDGVVDRLDVILEIAKDCPQGLILVSTAGYSKKHPITPQPERVVSLADQLHRFVANHRSSYLNNLVAKPLCWSTRDEVRAGIKVARRIIADRQDKARLVLASNWWHLPRIWLYTQVYVPKDWQVIIAPSKRRFSIRDLLMEGVKTVRDISYFIRVVARLRHYRA